MLYNAIFIELIIEFRKKREWSEKETFSDVEKNVSCLTVVVKGQTFWQTLYLRNKQINEIETEKWKGITEDRATGHRCRFLFVDSSRASPSCTNCSGPVLRHCRSGPFRTSQLFFQPSLTPPIFFFHRRPSFRFLLFHPRVTPHWVLASDIYDAFIKNISPSFPPFLIFIYI